MLEMGSLAGKGERVRQSPVGVPDLDSDRVSRMYLFPRLLTHQYRGWILVIVQGTLVVTADRYYRPVVKVLAIDSQVLSGDRRGCNGRRVVGARVRVDPHVVDEHRLREGRR